MHRRFRAGDSKPAFLRGRNDSTKVFAKLDLVFVHDPPVASERHDLRQQPGNELGIVAEDVRVVAHPQVDVFISVRVPDFGTLGLLNIKRIRGKVTEVMADPARHDLFRPGEKLCRFGGLLHVFLYIAFHRSSSEFQRGHSGIVFRNRPFGCWPNRGKGKRRSSARGPATLQAGNE